VADNPVSLVMEFMTPDRVECIAAAVGLDRNIAQSAVGASVPGLLAALSGIALQPGGAQKLAEAAERQSDTLGSLAGLLSDRGQIEKGSRMLSWLLGGGCRYALTGAIGEFVGLSRRASGSLLGMLIPVVMGTIAQQQRGRPLNADGVAGLFAAQKENITRALPPGFGNLLVVGGLLDSTGRAVLPAKWTYQSERTARRRPTLVGPTSFHARITANPSGQLPPCAGRPISV
jgi:hypothetical protein